MRAFRLTVPATEEDEATAALWEAGTAGIEIRPGSPDEVELVAYFADEPSPGTLAALLPGAAIEPAEVPETDWVARFREHFRPFRAGRFLIAPAWAPPAPTPELLLVDPGRAFGTGTHETTRLCLSALEELAARRPLGRVLDLGSGTAILAIAAVRLGARSVVASDVDPEAVASSRAHSRLNGARVGIVRADGAAPFRAAGFDVVVANLTAPLLLERAAEIQRLVAPGGTLALSGLLVDDLPAVEAAYGAGRSLGRRIDGEWAALVGEGAR